MTMTKELTNIPGTDGDRWIIPGGIGFPGLGLDWPIPSELEFRIPGL